MPALRALLDVEDALRRAEREPAPAPASAEDEALRALHRGAREARARLLPT